MNEILLRQYQRAKEEGRLCSKCKWMIPIKEWKEGRRICWNCEDAEKGVNVSCGHGRYFDEPPDLTGEMP